MTLVPVDGVVGLIAKAAESDPEGARELLRLGLYETLSGLVDYYRDDLDQAAAQVIAKRHTAAMDVLVRRYVRKRDAGEDTTEEEQAAAALDEVSKAFGDWWRSEPRDTGGRWTRGGSGHKPVDQLNLWAHGDSEHSAHQDDTLAAMKEYQNSKTGFNRLNAVGQGLKAVSGPGSAASQVGVAAQVVAALGPEAQNILKPGIQRAAYRYRGTERRPDVNLKTSVRQAFDQENHLGRGYSNMSALSIDQQKLRAADDAATVYLMGRLPDPHLVKLSQAANAQPPSEGVIIDADGDASVQAVGYNGDHYLPFDLKNLHRLSGGSYVRTRAIGGPTSEDIYTALMTNARQVQVVSNSGVFTIEFDPDLRGGRRYSDKAKQMVNRYSQLLQAVDSGEIYQRELDPRDRRRIEHEAYDIYGSTTSGPAKTYIEQETTAAAFKARRNAADDDKLYEQAAREVLGTKYGAPQSSYTTAQVRAIEDAYHEARREALQAAPERYKLNGEGYEAAMKALKQQFPYYIRDVNYLPLQRWRERRGLVGPNDKKVPSHGGRDTGYVEPGANTARSLRQESRGKTDDAEGSKADSSDKPKPGAGGGGAYADDSLKAVAPRRPLPEGQSFQEALEESSGTVGRKLTTVLGQLTPAVQLWSPRQLVHDKMTPEEVSTLSGADFLKYLWQQNKSQPPALAKHLMSAEGRKDLDRVAEGVTDLNRVISGWENGRDDEARDDAAALRRSLSAGGMERAEEFLSGFGTVSQPFRKFPADSKDWVLEASDDENPRPMALPFFDDSETNPQAYDEYLKHQPEISKVVDEIDSMDNPAIGTLVNQTIDDLNHTRTWGERLQRGESKKPPGVPEGVTEAEARKTAFDFKGSPLYKRLRNLQVAWTVREGQFASAELNQIVEGVTPGKAEAPEGRREIEGPVSMRFEPRVIVHRSDSPVAKAYARQLAHQKPRGRLLPI